MHYRNIWTTKHIHVVNPRIKCYVTFIQETNTSTCTRIKQNPTLPVAGYNSYKYSDMIRCTIFVAVFI